MNRKIPLGVTVRDKVTGMVGIAENRATYMYGCDRYCVQPQIDKEGKVPDSRMIDEPQLEIVPDIEPVMQEPAEPEKIVKLGQLVYDPVRDIEATVTGRAVYLNGCARIWVVPKNPENETLFDGYWIEEKAVEPRKGFLGREKITKESERETSDQIKSYSGGPAPSNSKY